MMVIAMMSKGWGNDGLKRGVIVRRARGWRGVVITRWRWGVALGVEEGRGW